MLLLDKGRLLVGIKLDHLLVLIALSLLTFASMAAYREHAHGYSNIVRVEGGWKAQWSGAWHPWAEIETLDAFKDDKDDRWRWLHSGERIANADSLGRHFRELEEKRLVEKFKGK
jgi:hypothetical protein